MDSSPTLRPVHNHPYNYAVDAAAATHVGVVRDNNEDAFVFDAENGIFIVADGIGGLNGGEIASDIAVTTAHQALLWGGRDLSNAFFVANSAVWQAAQKNPKLLGMGTTLVAIAAHGSNILIAHTGDSRAYRLRSNTLMQLTEDHSLPPPNDNVVTEAIGVYPGEPLVVVRSSKAMRGDVFLLCSDGLSNAVLDIEIRHILQNTKSAKLACRDLVSAALSAGGPDNVTVIVIKVR